MLIKRSGDRGQTETNWLHSEHTFSFGSYQNRDWMGFSVMCVLNEDTVQPKGGFAPHNHQNMEIVSIVLSGELEHKDSLGNGSVIKAGDVQRMSAGTGIQHSEFNPSNDNTVHFFQIWFKPTAQDQAPNYEQRSFPAELSQNNWILLVSPSGNNESVSVGQAVSIYRAHLAEGKSLTPPREALSQAAWIQVAKGSVLLEENTLHAGDGIGLNSSQLAQITANEDSELYWFSVPESL